MRITCFSAIGCLIYSAATAVDVGPGDILISDGDGFTNLDEFQAGTDPQNAADFPAEKNAPIAIFILLSEDED